jgi:hypothetical protein
LKTVQSVVLLLVKEQGSLTQQQIEMAPDYASKEIKDLLQIYGPAGATVSL